MTIFEQIKELLKDRQGSIVSSFEVKSELSQRNNSNINSILLSDYCYNRYNKGIKFNQHIFLYINQSSYKYLGENFNYTGLIFHKPKELKEELIVGEWRNGIKYLYDNPINAQKGKNETIDLIEISKDQIVKLYEEYNEILRLELNILNCKATELRHLIGRIGEFYCAIKTDGYLTKKTNQHGFDVISNIEK